MPIPRSPSPCQRFQFSGVAGLVLSLLLLTFISAAHAQTPTATTADGFKYTTNAGQITITKYSGPDSAVNIPGAINGLPVTSIGAIAFNNCRSLTSVTIPNSVTSIQQSAFGGCSLIDVTIPNGVTSIGDGAFINCRSLTGVTIPPSVTSIGLIVFSGCKSLTSITVDTANPAYSSSADGVLFDKHQTTLIQCPAGRVGTYTIPKNVTSIGDYAFMGCDSLASVTIPNSVTSIGKAAFNGCKNLTSMTIPASVTRIGATVFSFCDSLTSITVDAANTVYGGGADGVLFDKSKTTLIQCLGGKTGDYTIPSSVTSIGEGAFSGCKNLSSVTIPASVTSIGRGAFINCGSLTSVMIPNGVTRISDHTFMGCKSLTSVTIPASVTRIEAGAFRECTCLTGITIPNSVTSIDYEAFMGCTSLTSVTIPSGITRIMHEVFVGCRSLSSVTIPASITRVEGGAFAFCASLKTAIFMGNAPSMIPKVFTSTAPGFTVQYYNDAKGFTSPTWNGYPAVNIGARPAVH